MKIIFFGTPYFAAEALRYLLGAGISIAAIVTQPDRPKGRSGAPTPSPVKQIALEAGLDVMQPEKASQADFLASLASYRADLYVVVAFGQILPQSLLDIPPLGCINVHASLLPAYRGAAPMQRSLMDGVKETGVCVQKMVKQLDAGDVIAERKIDVPLDMTFGELQTALCRLSQDLLLSVIRQYANGVPLASKQDPSLVSFAPKITTEECQIDWSLPAASLHHRVRALSPRPGAWCWVQIEGEKKRLKILRSHPLADCGQPGQFTAARTAVFCSEGALQLLEVQPDGKKAMKASDWLRGLKAAPIFRV